LTHIAYNILTQHIKRDVLTQYVLYDTHFIQHIDTIEQKRRIDAQKRRIDAQKRRINTIRLIRYTLHTIYQHNTSYLIVNTSLVCVKFVSSNAVFTVGKDILMVFDTHTLHTNTFTHTSHPTVNTSVVRVKLVFLCVEILYQQLEKTY